MFKKFILCTFIFAQLFAGNSQTPSVDVNVKLDVQSIKNVAKQTTEEIVAASKEINSQLEQNTSSFMTNLGKALEKTRPGIASVGQEINKNMLTGVLGATSIVAGGFLVVSFGRKYINKYLFEPNLIEKKSGGIVGFFKSFFKKKINIKDEMIINSDLEQDLNYIINITKNVIKNGGEFENVLLHGEPGTGKTLFAKLLAESCGMDYAFVPAANISQFLANQRAVEELNNLFEWAASSRKGTLIFFDEADTFLADRSTLTPAAQNALSAFLARTGTPSNKIMIICATNRPEVFDKAVMSRLGLKVEFKLPVLEDREKILTMHINKIFGVQKGKFVYYDLLRDPRIITEVSQRLKDCSGRTIQKFVNRLRQSALSQDSLDVNIDLINKVLNQIIKDEKTK